MQNFKDLIIKRRSIRKFSSQSIDPENVQLLLQAGLIAPSGMNRKPCHFIAIEDKEKLRLLSKSKKGGSALIEGCALAIIVCADPLTSDVCMEDAAIAATYIQLQAEDLGLGSCWVQIRGRQRADDSDSEEYVRLVVNVPMQLQVLTIIAIGHKGEEKEPHNTEALLWENVHINNF